MADIKEEPEESSQKQLSSRRVDPPVNVMNVMNAMQGDGNGRTSYKNVDYLVSKLIEN
jgi:hypothetical protein